MTFDTDVRCLTIAGSVPAGGRLGHDITGEAYVAGAGVLQTAWRTVSGDGRCRTVVTIRRALESVGQRLHDMTDCQHSPDLARRCSTLLRAVRLCERGIGNLRATYASDASTQAALDLAGQHAADVAGKAEALAARLEHFSAHPGNG